MINHISIGAHDPARVANVIAELWDGIVIPFPPCPNSFMVFADDGKGTAVEITPADTILIPGKGLPLSGEIDSTTPAEEYEAKFAQSETVPQYVATHLNLNTHLSEEEVRQIGRREGWRTLVCNRGGGLFQLIELWIEDRFMLEVMTPEQTERYLEVTNPEFFSQLLGISLPRREKPAGQLNLIG